jgi:hypothetical protein
MTDTIKPAVSGAAHTYILLDRTGSMSGIWDEALVSVNAYASELVKLGDPLPDVTLAVFDAQDGLQFDVLRRKISAANWTNVTNTEASPRGMTPLFDALARIIAMAEGDNPERAVIVVMTDGEENSSREVTKTGVKAALERVTKRGWQTVFLGADFANFADADAIGVAGAQSMGVAQGKMALNMRKMASKSQAYFRSAAPMAFDEKDRAEAGEADVQARTGQSQRKGGPGSQA